MSCLTLFERAAAVLAAASFLGPATAVLEKSAEQGLPRCPYTLARLGQDAGER